MQVSVITIGNELLLGEVADTNSSFIARNLSAHNYKVRSFQTVADDRDEIERALSSAIALSDIIILSGGIGPTKDDITKQVLADFFHSEMKMDQSVLNNINEILIKRRSQMNELTRLQALVPIKATVIQNKVGTAPILWFEENGKIIISLPGVPFELRWGIKNEIIPRLDRHAYPLSTFRKQSFIVAGLKESALSELLNTFEENLPKSFSLAYLPSFSHIRLRLMSEDASEEEFKQLEELLITQIRPFLIAVGKETLVEVLEELLLKYNLTVSTAESCTGGNIAHQITLIPGASRYFKGGIVSYCNEEKKNLLDVDDADLSAFGAVSQPVVEQMAEGACKRLDTDCSVSVSGIAGPDGGTEEKPVGTIWIGSCLHGEVISNIFHLGKSRVINIERSTNEALLMLIKQIQKRYQDKVEYRSK